MNAPPGHVDLDRSSLLVLATGNPRVPEGRNLAEYYNSLDLLVGVPTSDIAGLNCVGSGL